MLYVDVSIDFPLCLKISNELLSRTRNKLKNQNTNIYSTGDFNVNSVSSAKDSLAMQDFKNILSSNFLHPFINKPTRITSHSAMLIDNIYCNIPEIGTKYDSGILCTSISDHYAIFCISKQNMNQSTNNFITKRSFCDKNVYNFHNRLKNESWDFVYGSKCVQSAFTRIQGVIDQHFSTNFKNLTVMINYRNRHPWMNDVLSTLIKDSHTIRLFKKWGKIF